uniref:Uncharacterized protein n=1 Tax=Manihot esculenta TaxID=3983 RepID=A0A2C9UZE1_MANES
MGCGISKLDLDPSGQGSQITTLHRRNDDKEDETDSGKSVSSAAGEGGSGFLKRVVGSNEKERGTCSPRKDIISIPCFKQPQVEIMVKDAPKEKKSQIDNNVEENLRPSNAEDCGGSILRCPGSPSFRVYCENDFTASSYEEQIKQWVVRQGRDAAGEKREVGERVKERHANGINTWT